MQASQLLETQIEKYEAALHHLEAALKELSEPFATDETVILEDLISNLKVRLYEYEDILNGTLAE